MQSNRICLLGFSAHSENIIKSLIDDLSYSALSITWVSANDKRLTGLVINASFLDSPQIQKYINYVSCPVTSAYGNDDGRQLANEHTSIPSLDLREPTHEIAIQWLNFLLKSDRSIDLNSRQFVQKSSENTQLDSWSTSHFDLIKLIKSRAQMVIEANYKEYTTWIEPHKGIVFIDYPRDSVPGIDKWQWRNTNVNTISSTVRRLKANLWFFETLWQSDLDLKSEINADTFYKMERWPQPLAKEGRSQALRLAAFAQKEPVNVDLLAKKTGYDTDLIKKFIYAALNTDHLFEVSSSVLSNKTENVSKSVSNSKENQQKRSLLSRFRQKLGM